MESISTRSNEWHDVYELLDGREKQALITYNPALDTLRIECEGNKRMFIVEKEGILNTRTVMKNEYGVKIGQLGVEKWHSDRGFVDIEKERFFYRWENELQPDILIFQDTPSQPLLHGKLKRSLKDSTPHDDHFPIENSYQSLLLALCWYLFNTVTHENLLSKAI